MKRKELLHFLIFASVFSVIGTLCYIVAVTINLSYTFAFILTTIWPVSAIIFAFAIYKYISLDNQSVFNQLAFIFTTIAFVTVYLMITVQIGLNAGLEDAIQKASFHDKETISLILTSAQWIHLSIDLAWDMFIGISLILLALAISKHLKFGVWWSTPMALLGVSVISINLYSFPHTPESQGIIDIGPIIGTFMIIFSIRTLIVAFRAEKK